MSEGQTFWIMLLMIFIVAQFADGGIAFLAGASVIILGVTAYNVYCKAVSIDKEEEDG